MFDKDFFWNKSSLKTAKASHENGCKSLSESLYGYVKGLKKGDFAFDCLFYLANDANSLNPPKYMVDGLTWLEAQLSPKE